MNALVYFDFSNLTATVVESTGLDIAAVELKTVKFNGYINELPTIEPDIIFYLAYNSENR